MNQVQPKAPATPSTTELLRRASVGSSGTVGLEEMLRVANTVHRAGNLSEAESLYRIILHKCPNHPIALHMLGMVAHQTGHNEQAAALIEQTLALQPSYHNARNNLGNVYRALGQLDEAIESYQAAIDLRPDYPDALFNLGSALLRRREFAQAAQMLDRCVNLTPRRAEAHLELGRAKRHLGRYTEAQVAFRVAMDIDREAVTAQYEFAETIAAAGKFEEAVEQYRDALRRDPENRELMNGLAVSLKRLGHLEQSLKTLEQALSLDPKNTETLNNLGSLYQSLGENETASYYYRRVLEVAPQAEFAEKSYLFVLLNRPGFSPKERFEIHRTLRGRHDKPEFTNRTFPERNRDPERKLRIGYLSSDFRTHVVALNVLPVISNHDHDQFDVHLYFQAKHEDGLTKRFREFSNKFVTITDEENSEVAQIIEDDEVDILVVLAGRFDENRPLVATYRPAPIQVTYHDCATSGLEAMDYWLTDSVLHPKNTSELSTEELYRLPVYYQYGVQEGLPVVNPAPALENGFVTFGCFNKPEKINPEVVALWAEVLKATSKTRLMFKYFSHYAQNMMQNRIREMFQANGIGDDRLVFRSRSDNRKVHLANYHEIDIALDPFPFNGATTTFEALSMGVPVVTMLGESFVDRVAGSIATHGGFPEFVAESPEEYVRIAADLASNHETLNRLRASMRDRLHESPLCDGAVYAKNVEIAFRDMWRRWCKT